MISLILAAALASGQSPQIINLSCVEALVAIDQSSLAGVFSFISDKDGPAAFADLIVHNKKSLKKFTAKMQKDLKESRGVSGWDRDALKYAMGIYDSPLGASLDQPGDSLKAEMQALAAAPVVPLEVLSAARRKKG